MNYIPGHWRAGAQLVLHRDTTAVGNVGAGEDNLISFNMVTAFGTVLGVDGRGLRITAWGTKANNANAKTLKMYFGATAILTHSLGTGAAGTWKIEALVFRTAEDAQDYISELRGTDTDIELGTATINDGATINIKCTGEATSNNDIVQEGLLIEVFN